MNRRGWNYYSSWVIIKSSRFVLIKPRGADDEITMVGPCCILIRLVYVECSERTMMRFIGAAFKCIFCDKLKDSPRVWFRPRILRNVANIDYSTTILGFKTSMPVYITATALGG